MLSFEMKQPSEGNSPEVLEIFLDQLRFLQLEKTDHVHLMAGSWGGTHLSDASQAEGNRSVRMVTFFVR